MAVKITSEDVKNLVAEGTVKGVATLFAEQEKNAAEILKWFMAGRTVAVTKGAK